MKTRAERAFWAALIGAIAACSASNPSEFGDDPAESQPPVGSGGGTTGVGGGFDADGGACPDGCSADLHDVIDCNGKVLASCPADQACAAGACVAPCSAATASKSSMGCEYQVANPDVTFSAGACYAVFIANTWPAPVEITVARGGETLDASSFARIPSGSGKSMTYAPLPNGKLPPNEIAILFLAQFGAEKLYTPACPAGVTPAISTEDAALHGTGYGKSFQITTSAPVVAYDIFPYGGGKSAITSATLLLPTSVWDTNYVAVAPYKRTITDPNFESWLQILASEDDTSVTISPTAAIVGGGGLAGTPKGTPATYMLQKGEVLQLTQDEELSGSPILADKPIAVVGGNRCMNMPDTASACDAGHQAIPPVKALGHEYVAVRYRNRIDGLEEAPPWRMVGAVDGTVLTYDPPMPGAPQTLSSGEVVEFRVAGPFVVKSQGEDHPFYMSAHMTGCSEISFTGSCPGDPESVNVIPPQQYLGSYVFFTDPTYPETNLVVVRAKGAVGFEEVELDCAGTLGDWKPIGSSGSYEYARIDLVRHDFAPQNGCDNGRHEISSKAPFGLTIWGWGSAETGGGLEYPSTTPGFYTQYVSYAYPAGASVQPITDVEVPPTPK